MSTSVSIELSEQSLQTLRLVAKAKGLTIETAASILVHFGCRLLDESPLQTGTDLMSDLDFGKAIRKQRESALDHILPLAEKTLLDTQGLHRAIRNIALKEGAR